MRQTTKTLTQMRTRADTGEQKNSELTNEFNQERQKFRIQIQEMRQDASDLQREVENLNEERSRIEQENKNEMDMLTSEKNSELAEIKDQLKDAIMEGSQLRMRCETAE